MRDLGQDAVSGRNRQTLHGLIGDGEYKKCPKCSRTFEPTRNDQKYCSRRCGNAAKTAAHAARKRG